MGIDDLYSKKDYTVVALADGFGNNQHGFLPLDHYIDPLAYAVGRPIHPHQWVYGGAFVSMACVLGIHVFLPR